MTWKLDSPTTKKTKVNVERDTRFSHPLKLQYELVALGSGCVPIFLLDAGIIHNAGREIRIDGRDDEFDFCFHTR